MEVKSKTSTWYVCNVKIDRMQENGMLVTKKENHVVEAFSPTEAETVVTKELEPYVKGEFMVKSCKEEAFKEYIWESGGKNTRWYKAKVSMIAFDENTAKEKRTNVVFLIIGNSLLHATHVLQEYMKGSMAEYEILSMAKTNIEDVIEK